MKYNEMHNRFEHTVRGEKAVCFAFRANETHHCCTSTQFGDVWSSKSGAELSRLVKLGTAFFIKKKKDERDVAWEAGLMHVELVEDKYVEAFEAAGWKVSTCYWSPGHSRKVTQLVYINPKFDKYKKNPKPKAKAK